MAENTEPRRELVCANCGKKGKLSEEVTVERTGYRTATPYATADGIKVEFGYVEDTFGDGDVIGEGDISCSACNATFASWEEATGDEPHEYRCTCGWWGVQKWLHDPDCPGELEELRLPRLPVEQEALAA